MLKESEIDDLKIIVKSGGRCIHLDTCIPCPVRPFIDKGGCSSERALDIAKKLLFDAVGVGGMKSIWE